MICNSCRRTLAIRFRPQVRNLVVPATTNAAPSQPPPVSSNTPATSSTPGISQPLSTPFFPSTAPAKIGAAGGGKEVKKNKVQSSLVGGTELKGLAYLKNKPQLLAKEDDEYPEWLWTILDEAKPTDGSGKAAVDVAALTKKQRAKHERKQARLMRDVPKPIPLHEQSRDLTQPGEDSTISLQRREELTKSSREARRKGIRENNFLRGV